MKAPRLYVMSGVLRSQDGTQTEVFCGCRLTDSEDEARGHHLRWMQEQKPGYLVHSVYVWAVDDAIVLAAAAQIKQ